MAQPANPLKVHLCKSNKEQSSYIYVVHVLVLLFFCENTQCEKGLDLEMTKKNHNLGKPPHKNLFKMSFWKLLKQSHKKRSSDRNMRFFISRHIIVYKKLDFRNKTFLYQKIPKNGRVKHCSSYLILWSKFHFCIFKFTIVKVVLDFVIIWKILILAIC